MKATATSFKDIGLSRPGKEPTTSRSRGGRSNHQATAATFTENYRLMLHEIQFERDKKKI